MKLNEIPKVGHFGVLIQSTRYIQHEGDERSRTHPGHGYPAHTETINSIDYRAFENEADLVLWLESYEAKGKTFRVFQMLPVEVKTSVSTSITTAGRSILDGGREP